MTTNRERAENTARRIVAEKWVMSEESIPGLADIIERAGEGEAMKRSSNPRVEALRKTAKFLYCLAEGAPATTDDFKTFSDLCWLSVPMKYRMDKAEIEEIKSHPWQAR